MSKPELFALINRRRAAGASFARCGALASDTEATLRQLGYVVTRKTVGTSAYSLVAWPRTHSTPATLTT